MIIKAFSNEVLNLIAELSNLSIILALDNEKNIYADNSLPEFCKLVMNLSPSICGIGCPCEDQIHMCSAGLWLRSYPIEHESEQIGNITIGHRRLEGRDDESLQMINHFLDLHSLNNTYSKIEFLKAFEQVPIVSLETFDSILFKRIFSLIKYILKEHNLIESERKRTEEIKIRSTQAAHEFLIPIQGMVGTTEYLFACLEKKPEIICPGLGRSAASIAHDLLEKLIKLSFIADNLRNLNEYRSFYDYENVNYFDILSDTVKLFQSEANKKGITLEGIEEQAGTVHNIEASMPHIKQLFFNIIQNAVKYSFISPLNSSNKYNKSIHIRCKEELGSIVIEVSNYGIGITEEEIKKDLIFQQGYRGNLAIDRSRIGSGLGLLAAKRIVENHHGRIEVESKKIKEGEKVDNYLTSVKIYLPISQKGG